MQLSSKLITASVVKFSVQKLFALPKLENWMCLNDPFSQIRSHTKAGQAEYVTFTHILKSIWNSAADIEHVSDAILL